VSLDWREALWRSWMNYWTHNAYRFWVDLLPGKAVLGIL